METGLSLKKVQAYEVSNLFWFFINTTGEQLLALRCENDTASTCMCVFTGCASLHLQNKAKF